MIEAKGLDPKAVSDWVIADVKDQMGWEPEDGPFKPNNLIIGSTPLSRDHDLFSDEGFWAVSGAADGLHVDVGTWETFKPENGVLQPPGANGEDIPHMRPVQFEPTNKAWIDEMFSKIFGKLERDDAKKQ